MLQHDLRFSVEISDRARHFQDAIIRTGAGLKSVMATRSDLGNPHWLAMLLELTRGHPRVAVYFGLASETLSLVFPGRTIRSPIASELPLRVRSQRRRLDRRHFDV